MSDIGMRLERVIDNFISVELASLLSGISNKDAEEALKFMKINYLKGIRFTWYC